jgi:hypothetical protein
LNGQNGATLTNTVPVGISGCASGVSATDGQAAWLKIQVLRRVYLNGVLQRVELRLPASGRLTLSGKAIATAKASTVKKSRTVWIRIRPSKYGKHELAHHKHLQVKLKLSLVERSGRRGYIYKSLKLK